jgi:putative hydrolase of the HAD superfamily
MEDRHYTRPDLSHVETWIFDLDNTLYPSAINLFAQIDRRMGKFIAREFNISFTEAHKLQKKYYREYGTTLTGLIKHHSISPDSYMAFVHDIDVSAIGPSVELSRSLSALQGRKLVFTNASIEHAERVMTILDVRYHFDDIFDSTDADYVPKHENRTFDRFLAKTGVASERAAMFDDLERNLVPARALGMTTVWVRASTERSVPDFGDGSERQFAHIDYIADDLVSFLTFMRHRGA